MTTDELLPKVMQYFRPGVLAVFHSQSDKYEVWTDEFSGEVRIRDTYSDPQDGTDRESRLSVAFGFRMARNGDRSIAVWAPDLAKASDDEKRIWAGFSLKDEDWHLAPIPGLKSGWRGTSKATGAFWTARSHACIRWSVRSTP
jgi:hypothetical protein